MRLKQKQRIGNKTERQRYEFNNKSCVEQSNTCLLDMIDKFKIAHKHFSGGSGGTIDLNLDWGDFLKEQNESFKRVMSRKRSKGVQLNFQLKAIRKWNHVISTFENATKMSTQNAANNRYRDAIALMNRM